jgi:hypothetical protein
LLTGDCCSVVVLLILVFRSCSIDIVRYRLFWVLDWLLLIGWFWLLLPLLITLLLGLCSVEFLRFLLLLHLFCHLVVALHSV